MRIDTEAAAEFINYLRTLVARRRREGRDPKTDVLTRLILAEDPEELSKIELLRKYIFIPNADHETGTNVIGNALYMQWRYLDEKKILNVNPDLIDNAVEKVLRMQSPNQFGNRQTTRPVELGGMKVDKDINIQMCIGSANLDPVIFERPDVFDICRKTHANIWHLQQGLMCASGLH